MCKNMPFRAHCSLNHRGVLTALPPQPSHSIYIPMYIYILSQPPGTSVQGGRNSRPGGLGAPDTQLQRTRRPPPAAMPAQSDKGASCSSHSTTETPLPHVCVLYNHPNIHRLAAMVLLCDYTSPHAPDQSQTHHSVRHSSGLQWFKLRL